MKIRLLANVFLLVGALLANAKEDPLYHQEVIRTDDSGYSWVVKPANTATPEEIIEEFKTQSSLGIYSLKGELSITPKPKSFNENLMNGLDEIDWTIVLCVILGAIGFGFAIPASKWLFNHMKMPYGGSVTLVIACLISMILGFSASLLIPKQGRFKTINAAMIMDSRTGRVYSTTEAMKEGFRP